MSNFLKQLPIFALAGLLMTGCFEDNEEPQFVVYGDLVTVENPEAKSQFFMRRDDNKLLWFEEGYTQTFKPDDGQRLLIYYNILSDKTDTGIYDYDIRITDAYNVLTKGIFQITPETQDSIGNDPIDIVSMWIGSKYLNVDFEYYHSGSTVHYINLVYDSIKVYEDDKIHLEFRHNTNKDGSFYRQRGIASFDISSLQSESVDSVNLVIHVKKPFQTEDQLFNRTYRYSTGTGSDVPGHVVKKIGSFVREVEIK